MSEYLKMSSQNLYYSYAHPGKDLGPVIVSNMGATLKKNCKFFPLKAGTMVKEVIIFLCKVFSIVNIFRTHHAHIFIENAFHTRMRNVRTCVM